MSEALNVLQSIISSCSSSMVLIISVGLSLAVACGLIDLFRYR